MVQVDHKSLTSSKPHEALSLQGLGFGGFRVFRVYRVLGGLQGSGFRNVAPMMENGMENDMYTGIHT